MGCAKAPTDKASLVKSILDSASTQKAQIYAAIPFNAAQDSLNAAMTEINKIGPKSFAGAYAKAESLLAAAQKLAETARDSALINMLAAKNESDTLIANATTSINSIGVKIVSVNKKKNPVLDSLKIELDSLKAQLNQASTAYTAADYLSSRVKAKTVVAKADSIAKIVETLIVTRKDKK
jgi:hypothetical protein